MKPFIFGGKKQTMLTIQFKPPLRDYPTHSLLLNRISMAVGEAGAPIRVAVAQSKHKPVWTPSSANSFHHVLSLMRPCVNENSLPSRPTIQDGRVCLRAKNKVHWRLRGPIAQMSCHRGNSLVPLSKPPAFHSLTRPFQWRNDSIIFFSFYGSKKEKVAVCCCCYRSSSVACSNMTVHLLR